MAMESIYNVPEFRYDPRVERSTEQKRERKKNDKEKEQKKKKKESSAGALFENLANSLGQYSDEPFQFNG